MLKNLGIILGIFSIMSIVGAYSIYSSLYELGLENSSLTLINQAYSNITYVPHLLYYNDSGKIRYYLYFTFNSGNLTVFLKDIKAINNTNSIINELLSNDTKILLVINKRVHGFFWNISEINQEAENTILKFSYTENISAKFLKYKKIIEQLYGNITNQTFLQHYENYTVTLYKIGHSEPQPIKINETVNISFYNGIVTVTVRNNANIPVFFHNITVYVDYAGGEKEYVINVSKYFLPGNSSSYFLTLNLNGSYSSLRIYAILYYSDVIGQGEVRSNIILLIAKASINLYYSRGTLYISVQNQGNVELQIQNIYISATLVLMNGSSIQKAYNIGVHKNLKAGDQYSTELALPPGNYSSISIDGTVYYSSLLGQGQDSSSLVLAANPQVTLNYVDNYLGITIQDLGNINIHLEYIKVIYVTNTNITNETVINLNVSLSPYSYYITQLKIYNAKQITVILYFSDEIGQGEVISKLT